MDPNQQAERLVNAYADAILRLSYAYLKNTQDAQDICQTVFVKLLAEPREFESAEHEQTAGLSHCLYKENAGHHRFLGEVTEVEGLVDSGVLHTYDVRFSAIDDFVDEQERVAVGETAPDFIDIHQRLGRRVIIRSLELLALDFLANLLCETGVDGVAGA